MSTELPYQVLAYYLITKIESPHEEVQRHKDFFADRDVASRIYISEEGINGQMSASRQAAKEYMEWMHSRSPFQNIHFKLSDWHEQAFPRKTVKYRKNLVAYDERVDFSKGGKHVEPSEWREMLESGAPYHLIDVRNDYEWELGRFEGADLPECATFREFEHYAEELKKVKDPKNTPVMMYCTGGIRCELFSSVLIEKGFEKVYQLNGGVINYGMKEGSAHWLGKLFVFDDRLSVPISEEEAPVIGKCHLCAEPTESYFNCANMDCNHLFLSCPACIESLAGCCKEECKSSDRVRPYHQKNPHKPFRRKYWYQEIEKGKS